MIKPEVKDWIGGAHCVVSFNPEHYIESHALPLTPEMTRIEAVSDGQAYMSEYVPVEKRRNTLSS